MRNYPALIISALLLTACGSGSDNGGAPGSGQFEINKNPIVGQQISKEYKDERNEVSVLVDTTSYEYANCIYKNSTTTKTLAKVLGDDLFVHSLYSYDTLLEGSEQKCPTKYSYPGTLVKKSMKGEIEKLNRELSSPNNEGCIRNCTYQRNGNIIRSSGVARNDEGIEYNVSMTGVVNTESPWLARFLSVTSVYSEINGSRQETYSRVSKKGFLADIDSLNINFADYTIEVYNSVAVDVTEETLPLIINKQFASKNDPRYKASFTKENEIVTFSTEGSYYYGDGVECYVVASSKVSTITKYHDHIYENRLEENVLVFLTNRALDTLDYEKTAPEFHSSCKTIVDENNSSYSDRNDYIMHNTLRLNNDGSITLYISTGNEDGENFIPLN